MVSTAEIVAVVDDEPFDSTVVPSWMLSNTTVEPPVAAGPAAAPAAIAADERAEP